MVAVLTGNVLKDPTYVHEYHTGVLKSPDATRICSNFGNPPVILPNDAESIVTFLTT